MFNANKLLSVVTAAFGALLLSTVSIGAAVGPAHAASVASDVA